MRVSEASVLSSRGFHSATYKIFPPDIRRVSFDVNSAYGISILNEGPDPVDVFFEFLEPEGVDVGQRITLKKGQSWGGHRRGSGYCQFALQSLGGNVNREYSLENVVKGRGDSLYLFYFLFCNNAQKNSLCSYHSSSLISLILFIVWGGEDSP